MSSIGLSVRWSSPSRPTLGQRFWSKVIIQNPDECWNWKSTKNDQGYGHFTLGSFVWKAHRMCWKLTHGEIPEGAQVLHRCDNPSCCNPSHLFLGTNAINVADKVLKGRQAKGEKLSIKLRGENASRVKLNDRIVNRIRSEWKLRETLQKDIAKRYGVTQSLISHIVNRKAWTHI